MCASSTPSTTRRPPACAAIHFPACCRTCKWVELSPVSGNRCARAPNGIAATPRGGSPPRETPRGLRGGERFASQPGLAHPRRPGQQQPAELAITEGTLDEREFFPPPDQRP